MLKGSTIIKAGTYVRLNCDETPYVQNVNNEEVANVILQPYNYNSCCYYCQQTNSSPTTSAGPGAAESACDINNAFGFPLLTILLEVEWRVLFLFKSASFSRPPNSGACVTWLDANFTAYYLLFFLIMDPPR